MTLGMKLLVLRKKKGLSLRAVAEKSGVSPSTLSRLERDMGMPHIVTLVMLEDFYKVRLNTGPDSREPTQEQAETYLIGLGYNLEELRAEINALIDELRNAAKDILAHKAVKA